jgi:hypothetical protein
MPLGFGAPDQVRQWRGVPGTDLRYLVSEDGEVVSYVSAPRLMRPVVTKKGYLEVGLRPRPKVIIRRLVHRLVLEAFVGPAPDGCETRHLNGVRTDNRLENLAWGSPSQNAMDKCVHGTSSIGSGNACAKLTEEDVRQIREARASGVPLALLAERYGVHRSRISEAARARTWRHV